MEKSLEEVAAQVRQLTGHGMMDCRLAVKDAKGNVEKAVEILKKRSDHWLF